MEYGGLAADFALCGVDLSHSHISATHAECDIDIVRHEQHRFALCLAVWLLLYHDLPCKRDS